jgi:hypothetical protein
LAAAPGLAQNERVTGGFNDPVPQRGVRPVPGTAAASALVSTFLEGYSDRVIAAFDAVPAIVVAPSGMTQEQKDEFSRTFRATPDGFFAVLTFDDHDVVINGTLAFTVPPETLRFQRRTGRYFVQKAEGETAISFSSFGGDYLIQFVCHEYSEGDVGGCVTDDEAIALFDRIVPLGGGLE